MAQLLDAVIFNFLAGNHDALGKNFSLLYRPHPSGELEVRLAPLYGVVCTVYYPELSREMAMRIGDEYSSEKVTPRDFEKLAEEAKLGRPLVRSRLKEIVERVLGVLPEVPVRDPVSRKVAALIRRRCESTLRAFGDR